MTALPDGPPAHLRFKRPAQLLRVPAEVWTSRPLVRALAERELRALYKQAVLGVAWAVLAPVTLMIVFTIVLQRVAQINTHGVPYALFSYVGLVPWNFFAGSVNSGGMSLINQMALVNKLRCPREVFPLAAIVVNAVNALIAALVLILLFALNRFAPAPTTPLAIFPLAVLAMFTIAVALLLSATTVYMRDLRHALPILLQLGLFATPVVYPLDAIPAELRPWYSIANPLAPAIDGLRQTVLYGAAPQWSLLGLGAASTIALLCVSMIVFRRLELGFADVA